MIWVIERLLDDGTWHPDEMAMSRAGIETRLNVKQLVHPDETHRAIIYYSTEEL